MALRHACRIASGEPAYTLGRSSELGACAQAAVHWFEASGTLLDGGNGGVLEGLGTEIYPDGHQKIAFPIRTDCCGEAAMAYFFHALATGDAESRHVPAGWKLTSTT